MLGRKRSRAAKASGPVTIIEIKDENGANVPMRVDCQNGHFNVFLAEKIKGTYFIKDSRDEQTDQHPFIID